MKIEKINDKQIRCTLTREDLTSREIRLSELAYGSEKAKELFREMMQIAAQDYGFEVENSPLMIEAVPVSAESIILIVTKVDDPEELDSRFSRFSSEENSAPQNALQSFLKDKMEGADDVLGLIKKIAEAKKRALSSVENTVPSVPEPKEPTVAKESDTDTLSAEEKEALRSFTRLYLFRSLDDAIQAAAVVSGMYDGENTLYKNTRTGDYFLLIQKSDCSASQFNKVCNVLSEYSVSCKFNTGMDAYLGEHMEVIVKNNAIQSLSAL